MRYLVWVVDLGGHGPRNHVLVGGPHPLREGAILGTLCRELCKNGLTSRDAVRDVELGEPKEACVRWGARWRRHLANTIELSVCGGDVAFWQLTLTSCLSCFMSCLEMNLICFVYATFAE